MSLILGIDPGPEKSAAVLWSPSLGEIIRHETLDNEFICASLKLGGFHLVQIEDLEYRGLKIGGSTLETARWIGEFRRICKDHKIDYRLVPPSMVRIYHCGVAAVNRTNVWHAIIERFGGWETAMGRKATPGPLYGFRGNDHEHERSALAVALWEPEGGGA